MATRRTQAISWVTSSGNQNTSFQCQPNDLLVALCGNSGLTSSSLLTDNSSGQNASTWTRVLNGLTNTSVDSFEIWIRNTLIQGTASPAPTFLTQPGASTGGGICVIAIQGMLRAGVAAIRSVGGVLQVAQQNNQAAGTPAPVLPAAPLSTNPIIGATMDATNGSANCVPRAGYSELFDQGYNTPTTGIEVMAIDSGESSATITWGGATPSRSALRSLDLTPPIPTSSSRSRFLRPS